jgi:hypothetical protein
MPLGQPPDEHVARFLERAIQVRAVPATDGVRF